MSERDWILYIEDIYECTERVITYAENLSYEDFIQEHMVVDAVIRNLEVIGEAAKKVPQHVKKNYDYIQWRKVAGFRDILIHEYFRIDYEILWDIVKNKIPQLRSDVKRILESLKNEGD